MAGKRSVTFKGMRSLKDSRKGLGCQVASVFLVAVTALSFLPLLAVPLVSSSPLTPPGVEHPGSAEPLVGEEGSGIGDGGSEAAFARMEELASNSELQSQLQERDEVSAEGTQEAVDAGRTLQDVQESLSGISLTGEGGKLLDGRDRCFTDNDGYHRCYPTVFFIGTSKCGTTSLARWLDAHPATHWVANPRRPHQIEQTGVKEAHVFDDPPKGPPPTEQVGLHEKLFITSPKVHAESVVIDYTPHYLAVAETPHRIADMYGGRDSGLKFIITLREPASRSISSWEFKNEFNPKKGRREESRSLLKTVEDGKHRASKLHTCLGMAKDAGIETRKRDVQLCNPRKFLEMPLYVSHVGKSMYALQLERWFNIFGRENFKVVFTDDMAVEPVAVLEDVLDFLGLDLTSEDESKGLPDMARWRKITGMAYNKTKSKKKDELSAQVTDDVKQKLKDFFQPYNRDLEDLLGIRMPGAWE